MRKKLFGLILGVALVVGSAGMLCAAPLVNASDFFIGTTNLYAFYANSGNLLAIEAGNNEGNGGIELAESRIENALNLPSSFDLVLLGSMVYGNYDGRSGEWINFAGDAISFYIVKAADAFAIYQVNSPEASGSWSTYDLYLNGYGGNGGLTISHFNGYSATSVAPVPEPATLLFLVFGLVGIADLGRKKLLKNS